MASVMADLVNNLSDRCNRRDAQILKAIDALEEVRNILLKSKKPIEKERLIWICQKAIDQVDMIEESGGLYG